MVLFGTHRNQYPDMADTGEGFKYRFTVKITGVNLFMDFVIDHLFQVQ